MVLESDYVIKLLSEFVFGIDTVWFTSWKSCVSCNFAEIREFLAPIVCLNSCFVVVVGGVVLNWFTLFKKFSAKIRWVLATIKTCKPRAPWLCLSNQQAAYFSLTKLYIIFSSVLSHFALLYWNAWLKLTICKSQVNTLFLVGCTTNRNNILWKTMLSWTR